MSTVRGLRVSVKAAEPEPMEVEEGELLLQAGPPAEPVSEGPVGREHEAPAELAGPGRRALRELLPDTSRRYENKAGSFITGIDVTSKEAIEKKEQRAKRFHFRAEVNLAQRNVALDRDMMKKGTESCMLLNK
ncbi:nuclear cap-binding protein subunit 3-like [Varanus komodoensis]|uniref:nuclear cap-binding protein subunit 3-like n=1 Tax=Varanus komodoensis TaxID=61221 RepID=UPI001CF7C0FB|nr:nuclear cap-binding protein subunit 3-like [Varanus komodoensis]